MNASAQPVLALENVSRVFDAQGAAFTALSDVSFAIREGEFVSIVGPSGCGKSTLLQIMAGLCVPSQGRALIEGTPIAGPNPDRVGVVFQEALLLPWKTAAENVAFPLKLQGASKAEQKARAVEYLALVGLSDFADRTPAQLSGGMRQRVSIARALARRPRVLLMDEPFGALDEQTRTRMWAELARIHAASGATIVFITHSLVEAVYLADRVLVMAARPGRIVATLNVDLARPRGLDMLGSPRLGELRNEIWRLIAPAEDAL